jgi:hypothetical protein
MRRKSEPEYVLAARRHLSAARRRLYRQSVRVSRLKDRPRDTTRAVKLLKQLEQRERKSAKYLEMVLGWLGSTRAAISLAN